MLMTKYSKKRWGTEKQTQEFMGDKSEGEVKGNEAVLPALCSLLWDLCSFKSGKEEGTRNK